MPGEVIVSRALLMRGPLDIGLECVQTLESKEIKLFANTLMQKKTISDFFYYAQNSFIRDSACEPHLGQSVSPGPGQHAEVMKRPRHVSVTLTIAEKRPLVIVNGETPSRGG